MVFVHVKREVKYRVNLVESELGWGSKIDGHHDFDTPDEAQQFAREYNVRYNNAERVPDWYIRADYVGEVVVEPSGKPPIFMVEWKPFETFKTFHRSLRDIMLPETSMAELIAMFAAPIILEGTAEERYATLVLPQAGSASTFRGFRTVCRDSVGKHPPLYRLDQLPAGVPGPTIITAFSEKVMENLVRMAQSTVVDFYRYANVKNVDPEWKIILGVVYKKLELELAIFKIQTIVDHRLPGWPQLDKNFVLSMLTYSVVMRSACTYKWNSHAKAVTRPDDQVVEDLSAQPADDHPPGS